jgi:hypothetical protein
MTTRLGLSAMKRHTSYAPLAALGYVLHQSDFFAPLREHVKLGGKTILHEPYQKLLDVVVSVLADCASLKQINTRLRPDTALAAAWGREGFADQSTITRVLDAFTPLAVAQLRTAIEQIYRLLAWTREWIFRDSPLADAGIYRMVKELLPIPGKVVIDEGHIVKLRLKPSHPLAKPMLVCLARLFDRFGTPGILRKS